MKNIIPTKKLEQALRYKDDTKIRKLIRQGYDLSQIDLTKVFALKTDVILSLIKYNKYINRKNDKDYTPLLLSILKGDERIVEQLLKYGANVNFKGKVDRYIGDITPLSFAFQGKKNLKIIKLLIKHGADLKQDNIGWMAFKKAILNDDKEVYEFLIDCQIHLGPSFDLCSSILYYAVQNNNFKLLKRVIEEYKITNVNYSHIRLGKILLPMAVANESYEIVEFLIKSGIDINQEFSDGTNSLMIAVNYMLDEEQIEVNQKIIQLLIKKGININKETDKGFTALMIASKDKKSTKNIEILLDNGAKINHRNKKGLTALMSSIKEENFLMTQLLIKKGADVNISDNQGITPLMLASWQNDTDTIEFLNSVGADINQKDTDGFVAYDYLNLYFSHRLNLLHIYGKSDVYKSIHDKILKIDTNHGIDEEKFKQWLEKSSTRHRPQKLTAILQKFSNDTRLKYTNHPWTDRTYIDFYTNLDKGWNEIKDDLKNYSETLYKSIERFLFDTDENKIIGYSSKVSKKKLESGTKKPDQIKELSESIDTFKQSILIKNDENLKLLDLFERVFENLPEDVLGDMDIDLDDIEEFRGRFYTDVKRLENAIEIILKDIHKIDNNAKVKITINKGDTFDLKIIHKNSSCPKSSEDLKNTIGTTGNFSTIYEQLISVCDWEIETTCSDGAKIIHYLYTNKDGKPYIESSGSNSAKNFTHTLRFYK